MYLHKDKETFKEIIEQVADDTGCAAVVIEKVSDGTLWEAQTAL